jgi:hypothetical protein
MKKRKVFIYMIAWIAVVAVLSLGMKPVRNTDCEVFDGGLLVTGQSGYELSVDFASIEAVEYRAEIDYGNLMEGIDNSKEKSGKWENDELKDYCMCVNAKVESCIILYMSEQTIVINYESEDSTKALYDAICEVIA